MRKSRTRVPGTGRLNGEWIPVVERLKGRVIHIGPGKSERLDPLEVKWPDWMKHTGRTNKEITAVSPLGEVTQ